jgi:hypothetical protein
MSRARAVPTVADEVPPARGGLPRRSSMKLTLSKETLVELTADDMSAVVGGVADSGSCSIASCVTNGTTSTRYTAYFDVNICDGNN